MCSFNSIKAEDRFNCNLEIVFGNFLLIFYGRCKVLINTKQTRVLHFPWWFLAWMSKKVQEFGRQQLKYYVKVQVFSDQPFFNLKLVAAK